MAGFASGPGFESSVYNPNLVGLAACTWMMSRQVDHHGHMWLFSSIQRLRCFAQDGTVLQTYDTYSMIADLATWVAGRGGGVNLSSPGTSNPAHFGVIGSGDTKYLMFLARMDQGSFPTYYDTLALYEIASDGALTIKSVVWLTSNGEGNGYPKTFDLAGYKTNDDPIVVWQTGYGSNHNGGHALVFPSINSLLNGGAGRCSGVQSTRYPFTNAVSLGDANYNLGNGTFNAYGVSASGLGGSQPAFFMPGPGGKTYAYIYVGKNSMANNHALVAASNPDGCLYVDSLYATYPNGCLIKMDLGVLTNPAYGTTSLATSTLAPAVANGCFSGSGGAYDAFTDVGANFDGTGSHAINDYFATPSVLAVSGGLYQVAWYRPTFQDDSYGVGSNVYVRARVMNYDPATGVFTDSFIAEGAVATTDQIGGPNANFLDIYNYVVFWEGGTLKAWHADEGSATSSGRYYVWLGHLGGEMVGQVSVTVRIGKR